MADGTQILDDYIKRTGVTETEALAGMAAYGMTKILQLLQQANEKDKKLVIYYKTDQDLQRDTPSYKFE